MRVAIVEILAVHHEQFFDRNAATLKQTDLLGLFILDGGAPPKGVEVIFAEIFLLKLRNWRGLRAMRESIASLTALP